MPMREPLLNNAGWEEALKLCFRQEITISFITGKQNVIIFTKAAISALDNPSYMQLLINAEDLTLLLVGADYPSPDSIRISDIGKSPISQERQERLAWAIDRAGWKKGYRYTVSAIVLDVAHRPALCFNMRKAVMRIPAMKMA